MSETGRLINAWIGAVANRGDDLVTNFGVVGGDTAGAALGFKSDKGVLDNGSDCSIDGTD